MPAASSTMASQLLQAPAPPGRKLRGRRMHALIAMSCPGFIRNFLAGCGLSCLPLDLLQYILEGVPAEFISRYEGLDCVAHTFGSYGSEEHQLKDIGQLTFGRDGNLWICDGANHRVTERRPSGEVIRTIAGGGITTGATGLSYPTGVAVMQKGESFFISDTGNDRICEFNIATGLFKSVLDLGGASFSLSSPDGICLSPDETMLAVADKFNSRIVVVGLKQAAGSEASDNTTAGSDADTSGGLSVTGVPPPPPLPVMIIGGGGSAASGVLNDNNNNNGTVVRGGGDGQFSYPTDVRFTPSGKTLVVADRSNRRVQVFNANASGSFVFVRKIETFHHLCSGVAVDIDGNILALMGGHVKVFSLQGLLLHDRLGGLPLSMGVCSGQACVAVDLCSGRIAVGQAGCSLVYSTPVEPLVHVM